jgi:hypothetical protein
MPCDNKDKAKSARAKKFAKDKMDKKKNNYTDALKGK